MLKITIPDTELWDGKNNCFIPIKGQTITLEHSLVALAKWESKYHKPFLTKEQKSAEETRYYVQCMTLTQNVDPNIYLALDNTTINQINAYIEDPMTATWFSESSNAKTNNKQITNELLYYWMIALNIPMECQKWHLNRLITLIKVCNEENKPKKKLSRNEVYARNNALNAARRAKMNSNG